MIKSPQTLLIPKGARNTKFERCNQIVAICLFFNVGTSQEIYQQCFFTIINIELDVFPLELLLPLAKSMMSTSLCDLHWSQILIPLPFSAFLPFVRTPRNKCLDPSCNSRSGIHWVRLWETSPLAITCRLAWSLPENGGFAKIPKLFL